MYRTFRVPDTPLSRFARNDAVREFLATRDSDDLDAIANDYLDNSSKIGFIPADYVPRYPSYGDPIKYQKSKDGKDIQGFNLHGEKISNYSFLFFIENKIMDIRRRANWTLDSSNDRRSSSQKKDYPVSNFNVNHAKINGAGMSDKTLFIGDSTGKHKLQIANGEGILKWKESNSLPFYHDYLTQVYYYSDFCESGEYIGDFKN